MSRFKPDWRILGNLLAREALRKVDETAHLAYQGMNVYGSYGENEPDRGLKKWADMRGTEEKGVDTHIATAMISLAWIDNYDVGVLVSSDRDFIPVVEFGS